MRKKIICLAFSVTLFILSVYIFANAFIIYSYGNTDEKRKCDVAIILGAETNNNGVSSVYRERINHGIWLYENDYADYIIVTGGKAENMKFSDAYHAKQYILSKGIPDDVVYMEEESVITQENIEYSKVIMKENNWDTSIIVSDPLHMKRSMLIAKDYDINAVSSPTPTSRYQSWKTKIPFLLREEIFYIGYKICKFLS